MCQLVINLLLTFSGATGLHVGYPAYAQFRLLFFVWLVQAALLYKSCSTDSPHESSVIAGVHEQLDPYELQDQKLVTL